MSGATPVLRLAGVGKSFPSRAGAVPVLRDVDLEIQAGEFVMVTGPSGSGKTTLLNLAALLDTPTTGRVHFDGADVTALPESGRAAIRREHLGMVFQKFCLLPHRTVLDNVLFRFRYWGRPVADAEARAREALDRVQLGAIPHRIARLLSAGEMQRLALARAVVVPPRLLVADEPTGNLDRAATEAVMTCLAQLHQRSLTILMVTHNEHLLPWATRHLGCRDGALVPA